MSETPTTTKPTDDEIDTYIAREYLAQTRGEDTGSFTDRLLRLAEEARLVDPRMKLSLLRVAREIAGLELENK